ncbi:MAG: pentapeptide repeat-containing protein [Alphaproteobacteria bacterium]|nr:MAG: pentapeptide repeat-containing protein [Alphaproteobacteria bacterium]
MDALEYFQRHREAILWIVAVSAALILWILWLVLRRAGLRIPRRERIQIWWRRNYVPMVVILALAFTAIAIWFWLWRIPSLNGKLLALLDASLNGDHSSKDDFTDIRNLAYALAAMLGAFAILATIPFQLIKTWVNERLATTTEQGHVTDRINKAVEQLGAEKTVKVRARSVTYRLRAGERVDEVEELEVYGRSPVSIPSDVPDDDIVKGEWATHEETVPNIEVRLGGIYALERIAQDSERDHIQIMEILCAYIRENAPADEAKDEAPELPEDGIPTREWRKALDKLVAGLERPRADIQAALDVIGRRGEDRVALEVGPDEKRPRYRLDLRHTNLQAADLAEKDFRHARLDHARLDGAILVEARLEGARLSEAQLQGADLSEARLQGADLEEAQLQGAYLREAQLQGADLTGARLQGAYLSEAQLQGASLGAAKLQRAYLSKAQLQAADLSFARLQGADLRTALFRGADVSGAQFDQSTVLRDANFVGSALRTLDPTVIIKGTEDLPERLALAFGDGSVKLPESWRWDRHPPEGKRPEHWPLDVLDSDEFHTRWRAWQREIGFDPEQAQAED